MSRREKITLTNDFHNTSVSLVVVEGRISAGQIRRAASTLCGGGGCTCSNTLGMRGSQRAGSPRQVDVEYSARTGKMLGAVFPGMAL